MRNAVVIPVYTLDLSPDEELSLRQCGKVLGSHDIVVVHPQHLDVVPLRPLLPGMLAEAFPAGYFAGMEGYNRLMLSTDFYDRFSGYDFILIYQTDAWVFDDRLDEWCSKGYDYIGAPWLPRHCTPRFILTLRQLYARLTHHSMGALRSLKVGNGGFSLRRPALFAKLLREHTDRIPLTFSHLSDNEDVFWSIDMRSYLRIPGWEEALAFSIEKEPHRALTRLGQFPFGCHGWNKPPYRAFWHPIILSAIHKGPNHQSVAKISNE